MWQTDVDNDNDIDLIDSLEGLEKKNSSNHITGGILNFEALNKLWFIWFP